jgi:hypothetical protein
MSQELSNLTSFLGRESSSLLASGSPSPKNEVQVLSFVRDRFLVRKGSRSTIMGEQTIPPCRFFSTRDSLKQTIPPCRIFSTRDSLKQKNPPCRIYSTRDSLKQTLRSSTEKRCITWEYLYRVKMLPKMLIHYSNRIGRVA